MSPLGDRESETLLPLSVKIRVLRVLASDLLTVILKQFLNYKLRLNYRKFPCANRVVSHSPGGGTVFIIYRIINSLFMEQCFYVYEHNTQCVTQT